jgi:pyruvate/2-oxoglutarate dehydrogenase complex dihydrolipoamide dehydrogenase (E3) component
LIIATGARSRNLGIPGEDAANVFMLKDLDDGLRIRHYLDAYRPHRAVVVGAGFIALEIVEALRCRDIETTMVYRANLPYSGLEPEVGRIIVEELSSHGVCFVPGVRVQGFELEGNYAHALVTENGAFPGDLFFVAVGIQPNVEVFQRAGIRLGAAGGIAVDERMQTNDAAIFAAGDCCEKHHRVIGEPVLASMGDVANKEGRAAGENAVGGEARFQGVVGAACVKVFGLEIGVAGLTEVRAQTRGFPVITQVVETTSKVGIYPGAERSLLKIVADQYTGRLLGGNMIGRDGEARKINTLAVALYQGMTLEAVSQLDLAYAPPYSSVMDPLLVAANLLKRKVVALE